LLGLSIDWHWRSLRWNFEVFTDIISGRYLYISISQCGPQPNAEICCLIWTAITVFTATYCGIVRLVSLKRQQKNYMAFAIPFGVISLYVVYIWLWAHYVLISYIHQMGTTPHREKGILCLAVGLILWCVYSALLWFPWERRFKRI